jgi:putative DNA primase/helicase
MSASKQNVVAIKPGVTALDVTASIDPAITPPETIAATSPSLEDRPCYRCHGDFWRDDGGNEKKPGVWWHSLGKGDEPKALDAWICGQVQVIAIARDKAARSFGQVLRFKNKLGHWQTWNMPTRLPAGRGDELLKELLDMGLAFNYPKRAQIAAYISSVNPEKTVWTAAQVGWFDDSNSFVLPDATIGKDADSILFQSESNTHQEYSSAGNLDEWRTNVPMLCTGNPMLVFTVSCAFAGALLKTCNIDGVGFHVFGESSRGKTTGLKLAASVWGHWEKYKRSWKATANGLEGAANLFNDGLLTLDEIGDGESKEISDTLYMLGNGSGKQRANVLGQAKAVKAWRIAVLSNGEKTIAAHLAQKGLTMKAGQLVRFLQIPLFGQYGGFDNLHEFNDGREFADTLTRNAAQYYGVAGREWLDKLTQVADTLAACPRYLDDPMKRVAHQFGELTPQETRAAKAFALVGIAGELATECGITGWNKRESIESALTCFAHWRGYRGVGDRRLTNSGGDNCLHRSLWRRPFHIHNGRHPTIWRAFGLLAGGSSSR